ncbi:MAG TPA: C40 family peptidase [Gaiellales bacterium]|nr:C40 family peptidase [Gaiellales bacterium]
MGRSRVLLALAALVCLLPATASAATTSIPDVSSSFWARSQILWATSHGWVPLRADGTFEPKRIASRQAAARVLSDLNHKVNGDPVSPDPYAQAIDNQWIGAGTGPMDTITQMQFDAGIVRVMGLYHDAKLLKGITMADGWKPSFPKGFGVEQVVRDVGARWNVPYGSDQWETWPTSPLPRANLAVQAYLLAHLPSYWQYNVDTQLNVIHALPAYSPLKQAVLGFAFRYAGAPYVWGGSSDQPQVALGQNVAGGFDCSGFVWWVMKRAYSVPGTTWDGTSKIPWRTTYDMAANIPVSKRIPYDHLHAGDILFWSTNPHGVLTASSTVYHTGIYLGNGWTINSHGSGAGVTIDYMGPNAGWFHDAFAFGWRVLPKGV